MPDIIYQDLDSFNKEIVTKYYKISGQINIWREINTFLIEQIHHKKSLYRRGKYSPQDRITKHYYDYYLFRGQKQLTDLDDYPCPFESYLENLLIYELTTKRFNYLHVYYHTQENPLVFIFNKDEWILSEGVEMTPNDIIIMEKLKSRFLLFIESCVDACRSRPEEYRHLIRIKNKIIRSMNKPIQM